MVGLGLDSFCCSFQFHYKNGRDFRMFEICLKPVSFQFPVGKSENMKNDESCAQLDIKSFESYHKQMRRQVALEAGSKNYVPRVYATGFICLC